MRVGDLLGSGTISGPGVGSRDSLLELSWSGREPILLSNGMTRTFIDDNDTLINPSLSVLPKIALDHEGL